MKLRVNKILFYIYFRIQIVIFLVSLMSLILIFLKLINFNLIIGIENVEGINSFFQLLVILSSIFVILFLPSIQPYLRISRLFLKRVNLNEPERAFSGNLCCR